jgi:localization factor PodJL
MIARTSWSAKAERPADDPSQAATPADRALDGLLDARFDSDGRLAAATGGVADRIDPRPPALSPQELERAVQKLARGLEAIERQGATEAAGDQVRQGGEAGRDFITYSLDRLEARLEALTKRLQQRTASPATADAPKPAPAAAAVRRPVAVPPKPPETTVAPRPAIQQPPAAAPRRAPPSLAVEADKAAAAKRLVEQAEARKRAAEAEARRRAELAHARRAAEAAEAESKASAAATVELKRQFGALSTRIEAMQQNLDANQIEPVRAELFQLLRHMQELGRDGRFVAEAVEQVRARLEDIDTKLNSGRELTGERLADLQDRLAGLAERVVDVETEIPGFDALRENQTAILERFDRMEGVVQHLFSADELFERIDGLKRQLQASATQREASRIEEQILALADRIEALPEALGDKSDLQRVETRLQTLAEDFAEARRQRTASAAGLETRLAELSSEVRDLGAGARGPDLAGVENRLDDIATRLDGDRRSSVEALGGIDRRIAGLAAAIEAQEDEASAEMLAGLSRRMAQLGEAIEAQDVRGARRDIEGLGRKLDELARALSEQREALSRSELSPVEEQLAGMQSQLADFARRIQASTAQFGPFAQQLQEISQRLSSLPAVGDGPLLARLSAIEDRLAGLAPKGPDNRALHNQLESIVSRLELLKGRSIDPARLNELFDRVDAAMRAGALDERFDRIENRIAEAARPGLSEAHFERLERRLAQSAGVPEDRLARLESKLNEVASVYSAGAELLSSDDLADLRGDIVALRRELRSLPGLGDGEGNLGAVLRAISQRLDRLPDTALATAAELETQIDRIAQLLEDPRHSRLALAHIETSLKSIERRLDETRRGLALQAPPDSGPGEDAEIHTVAGLARALSDDVTVLKSSAEASEKKTQDALDAVQDTLEAVVKRMAFLERDGEAAAKTVTDAAQALTRAAESDAVPGEPSETIGAPPPKVEPPRESAPGRLFSRFTSSQLLKRATGGRAESFSPDLDDSDDIPDLPLEPGTDSPLTSALTGAPSSDTALLSGARAKTRQGAIIGSDGRVPPIGVEDDADGDDFLAAARRAARAASDEAVGAEGRPAVVRVSRFFGSLRPRRRMALAAALAIAVAIVALQVIRRDGAPEAPDIAAIEPAQSVDEPPAGPSEALASGDVSTEASIADEEEELAALPPTAGASDIAGVAEDIPATTATAPATANAVRSAPADVEEPAGGMVGSAPESTQPPAQTGALPPATGPQRLKSAAEAGDPVAAFEIASRYAEGRDTVQDLTAAVGWYTRAAEAGLAPAQYRLGSIYEKGNGVPKDLTAAQEWYGRAAEAGNVKAMHNLAVLYAEGAGGEPDLERAADLFRRAAEHGVRDSQFNLAILHARGLGVPQDMIEAYKWFAIAAASGDAESQKRRDIIAGTLNEADLAKAQAEAAAFEPLPIIAEANEVLMPEGGWGENATSVDVESENELIAETGSISQTEATAEDRAVTENDLVAMVQELLAEKGYDPGPADGLLGRNTIQAITRFQEETGLPKTGQIDPKLLAALNGST